MDQDLHKEAKELQPKSWAEARSDKFKTTHGKTGVYFGEDKLKIGTYWIAHMASEDGKSADYSKPALVLQLHTHKKPVQDALEDIKAKLTIKNEQQKLKDDGRETLVLLVAADKEAAGKNDDLFFEKPGKVSDKKPNLSRLTECEDFAADTPATYYVDLGESGDVGWAGSGRYRKDPQNPHRCV